MLISVILEWENALLSELDRTQRMLEAFFYQSRKIDYDFEILIVHDPTFVKEEFIKSFIKSSVEDITEDEVTSIRFIPRQGLHYFALKNVGVEEANGETLILLDSDVIPEDNWLQKLLESHLAHKEALIGGLAYIDYSTFMGKCFGLGWFFPQKTEDNSLVQSRIIFSNNFIVDRETLLKNPYPELDGEVTRGADLLLWNSLREKGFQILVNKGAKVSHPAPNGINHFLVRGLAEGRDVYFNQKKSKTPGKIPAIQFFKIQLIKSWKVIKYSISRGDLVELKWWQIPFAIIVMLFYYLLFLIGGISSMIFPKATRRAWQI